MVEVRLQRDQEKSADMYNIVPMADGEVDNQTVGNDDSQTGGSDVATVGHTVTATFQERLAAIQATWPEPGDENRIEQINNLLNEHFELQQDEWSKLYNIGDHFSLRTAIVGVVGK